MDLINDETEGLWNVTDELIAQFFSYHPRMRNSEMKSERFVLRNMSIDSCPCIPRVTSVLAKTATLWAQKICAYIQSEFQEFSDIQEDSTAIEQHIDPAFIAYIKGEDLHPDVQCQPTARKNVKIRHLKKISPEKNNKKACKEKKGTPICQKRNVVRSKPDLRMKSSPVEELVFPRKRSFINREKVSSVSTEPPRRESSGKRNLASEHQSHECLENSQDSDARDSVKNQIGAEKITNRLRFPGILLVVAVVNALLRAVEKLCAYVKREWTEFNDIYGHESADVRCTEPAFTAYLKGDGTAPYISCPHVTFNV